MNKEELQRLINCDKKRYNITSKTKRRELKSIHGYQFISTLRKVKFYK